MTDDSEFKPDLEMAELYLSVLVHDDDKHTFQTFQDNKSISKEPMLTRVLHGSFDEHKVN